MALVSAAGGGRRVLISGASIAGPAVAFWLNRYGFQTTIVERAPELRMGGQNIDVQGAGQAVTLLMDGLEGDIRTSSTGEVGVRFIGLDGTIRGQFGVGSGGLTQELEILRGDLSQLLYDRTKADTEYVFGDYIVGLKEEEGAGGEGEGEGVIVNFAKGAARRFDLVVAADGVNSRTRRLVFTQEGERPVLKPLGLYISYFTIPRGLADTQWADWLAAPQSRMALLRPDGKGLTTRAALAFLSGPKGYEELGQKEQKEVKHMNRVLARLFGDVGWEVPRVLEGMASSEDFYMDYVSQVMAPRWSKGRVVLLGDAAYCPTALTGMGTTLALVGVYVLAGELAKHPTIQQGLAGYEGVLRPYVDKAQDSAWSPFLLSLVYPSTALGVNVLGNLVGTLDWGMRTSARGGSGGAGKTLQPQKVEDAWAAASKVKDSFGFELPDYRAYYYTNKKGGPS